MPVITLSAAIRPARGFTLTEIAISLALVSIAVLTIFLIIPQGIRTQNSVRYKILAAAKAQEMIDAMRQPLPSMANDARDLDKEGVFPWDTRMTYKTMAPDLETYVENPRFTIRPLPEGIAYRIDSDFDEIRDLLDAGGRVYYFYPMPPVDTYDTDPDISAEQNWLDASNKMLVGVLGHPQQNSILYHPSVKIGPYQDFYPTPPTHSYDQATFSRWDTSNNYKARDKLHEICTDAHVRDPAIQDVYDAYLAFGDIANRLYTSNRHEQGSTEFSEAKAAAGKYLDAAIAYAGSAGVAWSTLSGMSGRSAGETFARTNAGPDDWRKVVAMRYVANAAACFSAYFPDGLGGGASTPGGRALTLGNLRAWHEASVQAAVRHADQAGPYHWGASRPLNRQVMMDHPLVQLDLWTPCIKADFRFEASSGANAYPRGYSSAQGTDFPPHVVNNVVTRRQWRACYPQAIRQPGRPFSYPGRVLDTDNDGDLDANDTPVPVDGGGWQSALGDPAHFTLTAPFEAADRCRQLVFWAVDWQAYEDFETHQSAQVDASRYPIVAPMPRDTANYFTDPMDWSNPWNQRTDYQRVMTVVDGHTCLANSTYNPEYLHAFVLPERMWNAADNAFTGAFISSERPMSTVMDTWGNTAGSHWTQAWSPNYFHCPHHDRSKDQPTEIADSTGHDPWLWNPMCNLGMYGANRDGGEITKQGSFGVNNGGGSGKNNHKWSVVNHGTVPTSVRMRATTVARFNFYDMRVTGALFQ